MAAAEKAASRSYRRHWLPELIVPLVLLVGATVIFWTTDLDMTVAKLPYVQEQAQAGWWHAAQRPQSHWPIGWSAPVQLLYHGAPILTGIFAFGAIAVLLLSHHFAKYAHLRIYGWYVVLVLALGPGLLVNVIMKDFFWRPRPHEVIGPGARSAYHAPLELGYDRASKSFPCGHASIGFSFFAFYFIWRRHRPRLALGAIAFALLWGSLLGLGRILQGAHFLSDVIWAALAPFLVAHAVYYFVLDVPRREDRQAADSAPVPTKAGRRTYAGYAALAAAALLAVLLAKPVAEDSHFYITETDAFAQTRRLTLAFEPAEVELMLTDHPSVLLQVHASADGFGLPFAKFHQREIRREDERIDIEYSLAPPGLFPDLRHKVEVVVSSRHLDAIVVEMDGGEVVLRRKTAAVKVPQIEIVGDAKVSRELAP